MFEILRTVKFSENIEGKKVNIAVRFTNYTEKIFLFDLDLIKLVNSKGDIPEELKGKAKKVKRYEIFFKKSIHDKIKEGKVISPDYTSFRKFSAKVLSQSIYMILKDVHAKILKDTDLKTVNISVINRYLDGSLACHVYSESTPQNISIEISGSALAGRIYFPWLYSHRADISFLEKTLVHELEHHIEHLRGLYQREEEGQKKISALVNKGSISPVLPVIYERFCNLYTEGIAMFIEKKKSATVLHDSSVNKKLVQSLEKMSLAASKKEADDIYLAEFCPDSETGEYYMGYMMCYFIGLSIAKKNGKDTIKTGKKSSIALTGLKDYLAQSQKVLLDQLDEKNYNETYSILSRMNHYTEFLNAYYAACRELGIDCSLMDPAFYKAIILNAKAQKVELKKLL
jgi:hypothetical protein